MKKILVTDSLFIYDKHVKELESYGYEVERLDKPEATEDELIEALQGKQGYIIGGIEKVTDRVIEAVKDLEVILFAGTDWQAFIPGWQTAVDRGVKIANIPGVNAYSVAEYAFAMGLAMQRNLFELGRTGDKTFETTGSFADATVGVIGAGNIGGRLLTMLRYFAGDRVYYCRTKKAEDEVEGEYRGLAELLKESDIVFVCVPKSAGQLLTKEMLGLMKQNALIVSISEESLIDFDALLPLLQSGKLRAAIDDPAPSEAFKDLPLHTWFNSNASAAYNTRHANSGISWAAVETMHNLLETGNDENRVA